VTTVEEATAATDVAVIGYRPATALLVALQARQGRDRQAAIVILIMILLAFFGGPLASGSAGTRRTSPIRT
jgi:hypothetical protein